jgi:hypothetical protein
MDNALAVSALIELAGKIDLSKACIVFTGSEELSNEENYWCYGYRRFEEEYSNLMENSELTVVDTLGLGDPLVTQDFLEDAFLLEEDVLMEKAELITTDPVNWRAFYHSPLDTREEAEDVDEALKFLRKYMSERELIL